MSCGKDYSHVYILDVNIQYYFMMGTNREPVSC